MWYKIRDQKEELRDTASQNCVNSVNCTFRVVTGAVGTGKTRPQEGSCRAHQAQSLLVPENQRGGERVKSGGSWCKERADKRNWSPIFGTHKVGWGRHLLGHKGWTVAMWGEGWQFAGWCEKPDRGDGWRSCSSLELDVIGLRSKRPSAWTRCSLQRHNVVKQWWRMLTTVLIQTDPVTPPG